MATTFVQGNFKFEVIDEKKKTVRIMRKDLHTDFSGKLIIPSSVKENGTNYSVVEIGGCMGEHKLAKRVEDKRCSHGYKYVDDKTLYYYGFSKTSISEVVIPDSVKCISKGAFKWCYSLRKVHLPETLEELGEEAFLCTGLEKVSIPGSITVIPYKCFAGGFEYDDKEKQEEGDYCKSSIRKIIINEGVKEIRSYAFRNATPTEVFIPASVDYIGSNAFTLDPDALKNVIGRMIFSLKKAIIDDSDGKISIESNAFPDTCKIIYKSQMGFFGKLFH